MQYFEAPIYIQKIYLKTLKKIGVLLLPYLRNSFYQLTQLEIILVFFLIYDKNPL